MLALIARVLRAEPAPGMEVDAWERVRIQLDSAKGHTLRVAELARAMEVSPQYFRRGFRRRFGSGPKAYQLRSRLHEAVRRLREGDTSFKTIAYEMGFRDPKILYHAICRQLGIGPSKLRVMSTGELRDRLPQSEIPFPLNRVLVPPGTPADWLTKHKVKHRPAVDPEP